MWYLPSFFNFLGKTHFLQLLSYFNSFVYLRFKYGRPQFIIISEKNSYFKIRTLSQRYIRQWNIPWDISAKWRSVTKCDEVWRSVTKCDEVWTKFGRSLDEVWRQRTKFGQIIANKKTIKVPMKIHVTIGILVLGTGNLFATKGIKHYGPKIGGPNFW